MSESLDDFKRRVRIETLRAHRDAATLSRRPGTPASNGFAPPVRDPEPEMSLEERRNLYAAMRRAGAVDNWYGEWFQRNFLER